MWYSLLMHQVNSPHEPGGISHRQYRARVRDIGTTGPTEDPVGYTAKNRPSVEKLSPTAIFHLQQAEVAITLRKRGKSFQEIADFLGLSTKAAAYTLINNHITRGIREASSEVIQLELARLDALVNGLWDQAMAGDTKSVDSILKIMAQRAKYLGLDAPTKQEIKVTKTEVPAPPLDLADYQVKVAAALQLAGALSISPGPMDREILEGDYEVLPVEPELVSRAEALRHSGPRFPGDGSLSPRVSREVPLDDEDW